MIAWSVSLDVVSLFDLKLKHRPCRSTSWFISSLSDWPFIDFLALLCSKIGSFGCPRAVLIPHWVNTATVQTSIASNQAVKECCFSPYTILPLPAFLTSILPMSHQGASGPGFVQSIVYSELSTYWGEWGCWGLEEGMYWAHGSPLSVQTWCIFSTWLISNRRYQGFPLMHPFLSSIEFVNDGLNIRLYLPDLGKYGFFSGRENGCGLRFQQSCQPLKLYPFGKPVFAVKLLQA